MAGEYAKITPVLWAKTLDNIFNGFDGDHRCDRKTDGQTKLP